MERKDNIAIDIEGENISRQMNGALSPEYLQALADYAKDLKKQDLNNPCISYYGRLRYYSLQHTCQELNELHNKALVEMNPTKEDLERLRFLLHEHATAMRDLEYINETLNGVSEDSYNSFITNLRSQSLSTEPRLSVDHSTGWLYSPPHTRFFGNELQIFLQHHLPTWLSWSIAEKKNQPTYFAQGKLPTKISTTVAVISGLILSLCSAASVVVPIVIMSFDPSVRKSLITVSAAVVLFSFVLAAVLKVQSDSVFIATATYAAVLVVFVGVNGTGS